MTTEEQFESWEVSAFQSLLPTEEKVYTSEQLTRRIDGLEKLCGLLLQRLHEIDGKRLEHHVSTLGYDYKFVKVPGAS
jgi:hypothetical protein